MEKIVLIGSGDAGLTFAKNLNKEFLWISKEKFMTKKWLMSKFLASRDESEKLNVDIEKFINEKGIDAQFVKDEIKNIDTRNKKIEGINGEYEYDKLVIATGALPKLPNIKSDREILTFHTYENFTKVREKLKNASKLAIVGGGAIGFEMAMWLSPKYDVSIIEYEHDILLQLLSGHSFYRYLSRKMLEFRKVNLYLSHRLCSISERSVICETYDENEISLDLDVIVFSTGIRQNVPNINDEIIGAEKNLICDMHGNAFLCERTGKRKRMKGVYTIGDATFYLGINNYPGSAIFTEKSAKIVAHNITSETKKEIRFEPSIYYKMADMVLRRI